MREKMLRSLTDFYSKGTIIHWLSNLNPLINLILGVTVPVKLFPSQSQNTPTPVYLIFFVQTFENQSWKMSLHLLANRTNFLRLNIIHNTLSWKSTTPGHIWALFLHWVPYFGEGGGLSNLSNIEYFEGL